ncbi:hypothetical protein [Stappia indica]|uniref:Uncharacterized protein n=1 Tax=Stappia indica TaxID=538381 RepID=A0A285TTI7_9HYPH|nr:hypothetical protein [Stappia indica]SOC27394.1 hypothetical protein SAMN05421512_11815 [Stappia indica]
MDRKSRRDETRRRIIERLDAAIARLAPHPELMVLGSRLAAIREIAAMELARTPDSEQMQGLAEGAQKPYRGRCETSRKAREDNPDGDAGPQADETP